MNPLDLRDHLRHSKTSKSGWIRLCAPVSKEAKTIHQILNIPIKIFYDYLYIISIYESNFTTETSHWATISSVNLVTPSESAPLVYVWLIVFLFSQW